MIGLLVVSENVHKVCPISNGFLKLDHMGSAFFNVHNRLSDIKGIFNTGPNYGDPLLKNQDFVNRASWSFKLAQMTDACRSSWNVMMQRLLMASENVNIQTEKIHVL